MGVLWTVWEITSPDKTTERFIGCDILKYYSPDGWGYKDLCETMGVGYTSCPLAYLDMVPVPDSEYARKWRVSVREAHTKKQAQRDLVRYAEEGDTIVLKKGCKPSMLTMTYRPFSTMKGKRLVAIDEDTGIRYTFKASQVVDVLPKGLKERIRNPDPRETAGYRRMKTRKMS